jgi:hypothetical protein
MHRTLLFLVGIGLAVASTPAAAQQFFGGGGGIFDPEIDVVDSGIILDAQATVSADRKYVTMTMRSSQTNLLSLSEFAFQVGGGGGGFVGGAGQGAGGAAANPVAAGGGGPQVQGAANNGAAQNQKAQPPARPNILDKEGMTLVGRVEPQRPQRHRSFYYPRN